MCGLKNALKKRKGIANIARKNTNSSTTHTSSQHTSESLLNRYSSGRTNSKHSQTRRDSRRDIVELTCSSKDVQNRPVKESYVRIPLQIVNGIAQQKLPTEEIYV